MRRTTLSWSRAAASLLFGALAAATVLPMAAAGPPGSPDRLSDAAHDVSGFTVSPDAHYIDYHASGAGHLIAAGGGPVIASTPPVVQSFTPDSSHVVFVSDLISPGQRELFSTSVATGVTTRISTPMQHPEGDVGSRWATTSDGSTIVYTADPVTDGDSDIYVAPVGGGASTLVSGLSGALRPPAGTNGVTPDDQTVIFAATSIDPATDGLHAVPIDGSAAPTRLSDPTLHGRVWDWRISPDSQWIVYQASRVGDGNPWDTYAVPIAGGTPHLLHPGPPDDHPVGPAPFDISSDSTMVVLSVASSTSTDLFSIPIAGGDPMPLSGPAGAVDFALTDDGATVVFRSNGIHRVAVDGGPVVDLTGPTPSIQSLIDWDLAPGRRSRGVSHRRVVYRGDSPLCRPGRRRCPRQVVARPGGPRRARAGPTRLRRLARRTSGRVHLPRLDHRSAGDLDHWRSADHAQRCSDRWAHLRIRVRRPRHRLVHQRWTQ